MTTSRRRFLQDTGRLVASISTWTPLGIPFLSTQFAKALEASTDGWDFWGGKYRAPSNLDPFGYDQSQLFIGKSIFHINLRNNDIREHSLNTPVHAILPHPLEPRWLACSSKRADAIGIFDLKNSKEIGFASTPRGVFFNGHAAFADNGKVLIATCTDNRQGIYKSKGHFQLYRVPDLKPLEQIPMGRLRAHDLIEVRPDQYVAGLFGGSNDTLNFGTFDFQKMIFKSHTKKVQHTLGKAMDFSVTHVEFDRSQDRVIGLANIFENGRLTKGTICQFSCEANTIDFDFMPGKHNINLEQLSLAYDKETGYLWLTIPQQNAVLVWDLINKSLLNVIESWHLPQSVSLASNIDAVLIGSADGLKAHHRTSFRNLTQLDKKWTKLNLSSHLAPHSRLI